MKHLIHVANVLLLISFLVADIVWLRLLNVAAGVAFIAFLSASPPISWAGIGWNALFLSINVVQIYRLFMERRPVRLSPRELELHALAFRTLTPREFLRVLAAGTWEDAEAGATLVHEGSALDRLLVICAGAADVVAGGASVAKLGPGQLVGEMGFLTGARASASVVTAEETRYFALSTASLKALFKKHPDLRAALQAVIGSDLVSKLQRRAR